MAAALQLILPWRLEVLVTLIGAGIFALQWWGSYEMIRNVFRFLALTLLAYVGAAVLARPDWTSVIRGTLVPTMRFDREFLSLVVAIHRHEPVGVSLHVAIQSGGRGTDRHGPYAAARSDWRDTP